MTRREMIEMVSEAVIENPHLLGAALEGLAVATQTVADQHRGVRGYARVVKYMDRLDKKLQAELDDANALAPDGV